MSIKLDRFKYNLSQAEAEIRQMLCVGLGDEQIRRFLGLTPPQYVAAKRSMKKKVWIAHNEIKHAKTEKA